MGFFVFEKPKLTENKICEEMQNIVEKKERDSASPQTRRIFPWACRKKGSMWVLEQLESWHGFLVAPLGIGKTQRDQRILSFPVFRL